MSAIQEGAADELEVEFALARRISSFLRRQPLTKASTSFAVTGYTMLSMITATENDF